MNDQYIYEQMVRTHPDDSFCSAPLQLWRLSIIFSMEFMRKIKHAIVPALDQVKNSIPPRS